MAPQEVCTALHVCLLIGEDDKSFHMNRCEICEIAVQYFDTLLEDDSVEENIDQILEKVCRIIPAKNRPQCQAVIDTYGPYIASLIGQLASAHEVCEAIDLCQKPGLVHMYGGEQCKLGAPYWCISEQHAKACGELHYCKKSVWKN
ncbi:saposin-C-like [Artemia franciscana]